MCSGSFDTKQKCFAASMAYYVGVNKPKRVILKRKTANNHVGP